MKKIGLVLEGGGMRGSYTAGCLCWLIDNNIEFDYGVGISAGAVNLCSYALKNKQYLYDIAVTYMPNKQNVGLIPLLKERTYIGYNYMFNDLLKTTLKYDISPLKDIDMKLEIGAFDLNLSKNVWFNQNELDLDLRILKGACTLPMAGKIVDFNGGRYLDGGIGTMVPVNKSIENGCDKHLVIITKDESYIRKPAGKKTIGATKFSYPKYPALVDALNIRTDTYYREMDQVAKMVEKDTAYLIRPTKKFDVKRFSGDAKTLEKLFELGYQDMEDQKIQLLKFLEIN